MHDLRQIPQVFGGSWEVICRVINTLTWVKILIVIVSLLATPLITSQPETPNPKPSTLNPQP